jgi:DNA primase
MISYSKIKDQIKQKLSLQEIVEFYIGRNVGYNKRYKCPFNAEEEHYNLEVKGKKWKCYSCGESGDEIEFVKKLFNKSTYKEALMQIAIDFKLDTEFEHSPEYIKQMNEIREQKRLQEEHEKLLLKSENELFNILLDKERKLESQLKKVQPFSNENLGKYRYTSLASEFIKIKKQLDKVRDYIAILAKDDVDTMYNYTYNVSMKNKDYKEKLKHKVVLEYINKKGGA